MVSYTAPESLQSRSRSKAFASTQSTSECFIRPAISFKIPLGHFERGARHIDSRHARARLRQVQRESALIGTDIERFSVRISRSGSIVLALVEKRTGLLSGTGVVMKIQAVETEKGLSTGASRLPLRM